MCKCPHISSISVLTAVHEHKAAVAPLLTSNPTPSTHLTRAATTRRRCPHISISILAAVHADRAAVALQDGGAATVTQVFTYHRRALHVALATNAGFTAILGVTHGLAWRNNLPVVVTTCRERKVMETFKKTFVFFSNYVHCCKGEHANTPTHGSVMVIPATHDNDKVCQGRRLGLTSYKPKVCQGRRLGLTFYKPQVCQGRRLGLTSYKPQVCQGRRLGLTFYKPQVCQGRRLGLTSYKPKVCQERREVGLTSYKPQRVISVRRRVGWGERMNFLKWQQRMIQWWQVCVGTAICIPPFHNWAINRSWYAYKDSWYALYIKTRDWAHTNWYAHKDRGLKCIQAGIHYIKTETWAYTNWYAETETYLNTQIHTHITDTCPLFSYQLQLTPLPPPPPHTSRTHMPVQVHTHAVPIHSPPPPPHTHTEQLTLTGGAALVRQLDRVVTGWYIALDLPAFHHSFLKQKITT